MKAKIFAIGAAALLLLLVLNTPIITAQQDVEPGIGGLLDFQTNLDNIMGLVRHIINSFSLSTDWIRGIMDYIEAFPDNAGLTAGCYLGLVPYISELIFIVILVILFISILGFSVALVISIIPMYILIFILIFIPIPGWIILVVMLIVILIILIILILIVPIALILLIGILFVNAILVGAISLIGGYSVYSNSGESEITRIAGIIRMVGGIGQMTYFGASLSLSILYPVSLLLQLLGTLGVA